MCRTVSYVIFLLCAVIFLKTEALFEDIEVIIQNERYEFVHSVSINNTLTITENIEDFSYPFRIKINSSDLLALPEDSICDRLNLISIFLGDGSLQNLEAGAFHGLSSLRFINFTGNQIEKIEKGVFNGLPVTTLNLNYNSISFIDSDAFEDMPNLEIVLMTSNELSKWDLDWFRRVLIKHVDFSFNRFQELPPRAFRYIIKESDVDRPVKIQVINFALNNISKIHPRTFERIYEVDELNLDFNGLTHLPRSFGDIKKIKRLSLSHNPLVFPEFDVTLFDDIQVKDLIVMTMNNCMKSETYEKLRKKVSNLHVRVCETLFKNFINPDFRRLRF